jgi:hypothetical protein
VLSSILNISTWEKGVVVTTIQHVSRDHKSCSQRCDDVLTTGMCRPQLIVPFQHAISHIMMHVMAIMVIPVLVPIRFWFKQDNCCPTNVSESHYRNTQWASDHGMMATFFYLPDIFSTFFRLFEFFRPLCPSLVPRAAPLRSPRSFIFLGYVHSPPLLPTRSDEVRDEDTLPARGQVSFSDFFPTISDFGKVI